MLRAVCARKIFAENLSIRRCEGTFPLVRTGLLGHEVAVKAAGAGESHMTYVRESSSNSEARISSTFKSTQNWTFSTPKRCRFPGSSIPKHVLLPAFRLKHPTGPIYDRFVFPRHLRLLSILGLLIILNGCGADRFTLLSSTHTQPVPAPVFSPAAGAYTSAQQVTISDTQPSVAIRYTADGSTPTANSSLYIAPIDVTTSLTLKAIAINTSGGESAVASALYDIRPPALPTATPVFSPPAGTYTQAQSVTVTDTTPGAVIHFTTNGATPTDTSAIYATPIAITTTTTLQAIAIAPGFVDSSVASGTYTITTTPVATGQWTWMAGSSSSGAAANFGTQGVAAASNTPGAPGGSGAGDHSGGLWMFGGLSTNTAGTLTGPYNILWRFDTATEQWTWVSGTLSTGSRGSYGTLGVPAASNVPSTREGAAVWVDQLGNVWVFGGYWASTPGLSDYLNDMWKFDPLTSEWTWTNGSSALDGVRVLGTRGVPSATVTPSNRTSFAKCQDSAGNFWLFGGSGLDRYNAYYYGELWKFNPPTAQWTWVAGSSTPDVAPVYGTQGVPSSANQPGARYASTCTVDSAGNFWLFGGGGTDISTYPWLNDLWEYTPATDQWTWIGGSQNYGDPGNYGVKGTPSSSNWPPSRESGSWQDASGNLWVFGGTTVDPAFHVPQVINDLWKFDVTTKQWTWMAGSNVNDIGGTYGILGVPSAANTPGAKDGGAYMVDNTGNLWLYGGYGYATQSDVGYTGDLWRWKP